MDQYGFHFSICSMKFYCSSIHPPPPPLSLSFLSSLPASLHEPTSSHESTRNEITRCSESCRYTCVYGLLARKAGDQLDARGYRKHQTTKLFSASQSQSATGATIYHIALTNRDGDPRFRSPLRSLIASTPVI